MTFGLQLAHPVAAIASLLLLLAVAAYRFASFLIGEDLVVTAVDQVRLAFSSLPDLDQGCASNPRDSGLVVSLTTIPSRIDRLGPTLKSRWEKHRSTPPSARKIPGTRRCCWR